MQHTHTHATRAHTVAHKRIPGELLEQFESNVNSGVGAFADSNEKELASQKICYVRTYVRTRITPNFESIVPRIQFQCQTSLYLKTQSYSLPPRKSATSWCFTYISSVAWEEPKDIVRKKRPEESRELLKVTLINYPGKDYVVTIPILRESHLNWA